VPQAMFFDGSPKFHSEESACAIAVWFSVAAAAAPKAEAINFFLIRSRVQPSPSSRTHCEYLDRSQDTPLSAACRLMVVLPPCGNT
jgi:hypothetical protein